MAALTSSDTMSYLNVPAGRLARSASHDSFATDASMVSMSSYFSELGGSRNLLNERGTEESFEQGSAPSRADLVKLRERMFERMLDQSSPSTTKLHRFSMCTNSGNNAEAAPTSSKNPRAAAPALRFLRKFWTSRGSLCKSFSTSDLQMISTCHDELADAFVKHCDSQTRLSGARTQAQDRDRYLQFIKENQEIDGQPLTPSEVDLRLSDLDLRSMKWSTSSVAPLTKSKFARDAQNPHRSMRKASSDKNLSASVSEAGPVAPTNSNNAKLSRDFGRRIREDLLMKIGKCSTHIITKLDLDKDKGRPLSQLERNFIIYHWLQSLDEGDK